MAKKKEEAAAAKKPKETFQQHHVVKGRCDICKRDGAELKTSCPGYATAANVRPFQPGPTPATAAAPKREKKKK